ncbi:DUF5316 family protein [Paenibacillus zeirhizosphaerae]|uniref:DUF5316 family protein n=1 Tax=Paenibacillus zeirhizosphaerae TaxID=2987519 RepID=UPI0035230F16
MIGVVFIVLAIIMSGVGVSGDRMRANYYNERDADPMGKDRKIRLKWTLIFFICGVIFILPTIIIHFF